MLEAAGVLNNILIAYPDAAISSFIYGLSFGLIEPEPVSINDFNLQYCTLYLALYRVAEGTLGADVSGGQVSASCSDCIRLEYRP